MSFSKEQLLKVEKMEEEDRQKYIESLKISEMNEQTLDRLFDCVYSLEEDTLAQPIFKLMLVQQQILYAQKKRPILESIRALELEQMQKGQQQQNVKEEQPLKKTEGFFAKLCSLFQFNHGNSHAFDALKNQADDQQLNKEIGIKGNIRNCWKSLTRKNR